MKALVRHIGVEHAGMPNFKVKCGVDGCPEQYCKMNSLRKHMRTCHSYVYNSDTVNDVNFERPTVIIDSDNEKQNNLQGGSEIDDDEMNDEVIHDERVDINQVCIIVLCLEFIF